LRRESVADVALHGEGWPAARCTVGRGGGGSETLQEMVRGVVEEAAEPMHARFGPEKYGRGGSVKLAMSSMAGPPGRRVWMAVREG